MLVTVLKILNICGSALFMVVFFGACIFVHELGHFLVAKWCGLHIQAFSIGFKKIWSKKINGIEYRIGCLPLGGYVELPQLDSSDDVILDKDGNVLPHAAPWKRALTAFAGPFFNVIFALILGCVIWGAGLPQGTPRTDKLKVVSVEIDKPEYNAGLRPGDIITAVNGQKFNLTWSEFARETALNVGSLNLTLQAPDGTIRDISYKPAVNNRVAANSKIPYPFFEADVPVVVRPIENSAGEKAGVKAGDRIVRIDGQDVWWDDFVEKVRFSRGKTLSLEIVRANGTEITLPLVPEETKNYAFGIQFSPNKELHIDRILPGMPAEAHLQKGDVITKFNGETVTKYRDFSKLVSKNKEKTAKCTVERNGKSLDFEITPVKTYRAGLALYGISYPSPVEQLWNVLVLTGRSLKSVGAGISGKLGNKDAGYTTLGPQHFSGPIGIGETLYKSVYLGSLVIGLNLVVMISFSLGLFNLLPLPVLDGGHILLSFLEMIFRRQISSKILTPVMITFIVILIGFMLFVTFFDIKRLIPVEREKKGPVMTEYNRNEFLKKEVENATAEKTPDTQN